MVAETMADMARRENAAARLSWGQKPTQQINWNDAGNIDHKLVPRVMSCLREGLGVEDMAVNGTCTVIEARQVVSWMRENGSLAKFYRAKRTK